MPTDSFYHGAIAFFNTQKEAEHETIAMLGRYYGFSTNSKLLSRLNTHSAIVNCLVKIKNQIFEKPNADIITRVCDIRDQIITNNQTIMSDAIIQACLTRPIIRSTLEYLLKHQLPLPTPLEIILKKFPKIGELIREHQSIVSARYQGKYRQNLISQITIALSHVEEEETTLPKLYESLRCIGKENTLLLSISDREILRK